MIVLWQVHPLTFETEHHHLHNITHPQLLSIFILIVHSLRHHVQLPASSAISLAS